ncbi:hypothetical protein FHW69_000772 [Luteibacter sp. Sphag1AF]|uniref:hypothetical protein n=1 Tax=Luteibacter sp. Sphag1AF TaxID=2587031 RepID=UPI00162130A9|nr:hypothetical protein [Luteibacter sp. Sphag1AF]MBB3226182.1 hypothetical protein [Luteibacter sp. Sphag1AF]
MAKQTKAQILSQIFKLGDTVQRSEKCRDLKPETEVRIIEESGSLDSVVKKLEGIYGVTLNVKSFATIDDAAGYIEKNQKDG